MVGVSILPIAKKTINYIFIWSRTKYRIWNKRLFWFGGGREDEIYLMEQ